MFREALRDVVEGVDGGLAGMVMDFEGIPLESFSLNSVPVDIEAIGIEASVLVKAIRRATEMLEAGDTNEVSIKSERMVTLIRVLNSTYFVALTLLPTGNLGKARYLLRTLAPRLLDELR
jgi:predicted regulator of Ras-like GTPase activity (Roadblock/LC7/MglB family)